MRGRVPARRWHPGGAQLTARFRAIRCLRGYEAGASARLHNRILHQPRMGLLDDLRAANAERMAINEGKNLVGSKYGVKTLQAFPCQVLKEDWKADKLSAMLQVRPCQPAWVSQLFFAKLFFPHMRLGNSAQNCHARRPAASRGLCSLTHSSFLLLNTHVCLRTLIRFLAGKRGSWYATGAVQGDLRGIACVHQRR